LFCGKTEQEIKGGGEVIGGWKNFLKVKCVGFMNDKHF